LRNGDTPYIWRTEPFQMFVDGEWWIPPEQTNIDESDVKSTADDEEDRSIKKGYLGQSGQRKLLWLLRCVDIRRGSIARGMTYAMDRADAAEEVPPSQNIVNKDCRCYRREYMFRANSFTQKIGKIISG
jgi:U2-associated protein SR140